MSGVEDIKEQERVDGHVPEESEKPTLSSQEEEVLKKKYGGIVPKKPPLISKDHERAYFDSADWALGKQGVEKPKGPLEALRPKLQVLERIGSVAYRLDLPSSSKIHPVFHVSCLKKQLGQGVSPLPVLPPVDIQGRVQPEPEVILERRMKKVGNQAATEVLVKWVGASREDSSWEVLWKLRNLYPHLVGKPTQQQTRYRKSPCAPSDGEDGASVPSEDGTGNV